MPIFDQGYQHWQGPLAPFRWRWLAIARHGVRALWKSKIIKLALVAAWMPAILLVVILALWGMIEQRAESILAIARNMEIPAEMLAKPQDFRGPVWTILYRYFFKIEVLVAIFLVLAVGPGLISRDLRFNALPLYFSRPIRRIDYFFGKLAVIGFFIAATTIVPAMVACLPRWPVVQSGPLRLSRYAPLAVGRHPLRARDHDVRRLADARALVAFAAVDLRRHRVGRFLLHHAIDQRHLDRNGLPCD
jgi:hypothetical protein